MLGQVHGCRGRLPGGAYDTVSTSWLGSGSLVGSGAGRWFLHGGAELLGTGRMVRVKRIILYDVVGATFGNHSVGFGISEALLDPSQYKSGTGLARGPTSQSSQSSTVAHSFSTSQW